jgi:hypothetical protein
MPLAGWRWADFDDIFGLLETNPKNPPFNTFGANR